MIKVIFSNDIIISTGPAVSAFWDFELNTAGLDNVVVDGISKFALVPGITADYLEPAHDASAVLTNIEFNMADTGGGTTTEDPKLVINYALPCEGIHSATFNFVSC